MEPLPAGVRLPPSPPRPPAPPTTGWSGGPPGAGGSPFRPPARASRRQGVAGFLRHSRLELRQVVWPGWGVVARNAATVFVAVVTVLAVVGAVELAIGRVAGFVLR